MNFVRCDPGPYLRVKLGTGVHELAGQPRAAVYLRECPLDYRLRGTNHFSNSVVDVGSWYRAHENETDSLRLVVTVGRRIATPT